MTQLFGFDAFSPTEIAVRVETMGVSKAGLPLPVMAMLGILAGAFIGLGALGFVLVQSDATLGFASSRLLGGLVFSMGLMLVVIAGAELFTGNNLLVMAWAGGKISTPALLRNWLVVGISNFIGAIGLALLVFLSGHAQMNNGMVGETYLAIAISKCTMPFWTAFFKGVLCNALVCLAVWMAMAGHTVTDKVLAIVFPVSAFVAAGFEHSIANMYLIPLAMMLKFSGVAIANIDAIGWMGMLHNLIAVILGNIVGGSGLVGLIYYLVYLRKPR